ncbi:MULTISPECIES: fumarylacetoacetate hydrolase family protein [Sphingopyxis]|uniref:fumarylacetoacetate hydrolase family protein n=1 Tax=Sphingopyxis TaxID=165697 RepID=UPI000CDF3FD0|nr:MULTISPECIES: fumarylacetoacetate hydrolase family protein [Sphingopyxis]AVA14915.1 2-hydroxyhepta-2,4-diene-1,7-dioate isomerase [Sphingopyxis sp. MG]QUM73196.1 fumarylacetoacetate hydrolase family protein [Sphingopyxis granuli]
MKLLRYGARGQERPGLLDTNDAVRDLSAHVGDIDGAVLTREGLDRLRAIDVETLPEIADFERYGACVGSVGKFICIGLNYSDHAAESDMEVPPEPVVFMKATSAISGPNDPIIQPRGSTKLDWEVELAVVIGAHLAYADEAEAAAGIAGYCLCNDVSERAFQLERHGQWTKGKGCDSFGPIGPWLVTADEVSDPDNLAMWLDVNGKRFQDGNSRTMIYKPAFLVSYLSRFMSLQPGDIISTGTPAGVGLGQRPPVYLEVGDVVELGIQGLGTQRQIVVAAA